MPLNSVGVRILNDFSKGNRDCVLDVVNLYQENIRDENLVTDDITEDDTVFHEAAMVDVQQAFKQTQESRSVNLDGTFTVLEAARETDARVVGRL